MEGKSFSAMRVEKKKSFESFKRLGRTSLERGGATCVIASLPSRMVPEGLSGARCVGCEHSR